MRFLCLHPLLLSVGVAVGAVGCGAADTTATASLTWQLVDAKAPNPNTAPALTCTEKLVSTIRVQLFPSPTGATFDFPCSSMAAETLSVPAGNYTIQTIALGTSSQALAQLQFQQRLFGQTSIGHIIFQIP